MSRNVVRAFQTSTAAAIQYIGADMMQITSINGPNGARWLQSTRNICDAVERADPRIVFADIQGAKAHISSKDRTDLEEVITVGLQTQGGLRVGTLHVHLNGSFKFFPSRAGREGGFGTRLAQANIPGYLAGEDDPWDKTSPAKGGAPGSA
ncbi:uncharacterized protein BO80DRAFT_425211 [Aspergillus ibericus CBS 121593]|uniref:Uncharacterized protein n=1 Tax=Aspergillus ibericus CBS 121593 TaxID=1448316 RepID=A0A395GZK9_9EURO|nr:hypothetical protein BO80DRAFT_425211 [Aspergillus ibericus CBS 121593]RAL00800.1 hypothetical protein BO80DRAFT_425211 [Aspergillus ibericus CBS 121593]